MQRDRAERWAHIKTLLAQAFELPALARPAFLADACGDDEQLRMEVEQLLAAHERAPAFLESRPPMPADTPPQTLEGRRVGPYEFLARIGAGGMGEVYKARDLRLDRTVAIKVLPPHLASDRQSVERFAQEARAVAALNHPHICTLHDVGYLDGAAFLVMEYLEGETLAARLGRGRIKQSHALQYAAEVASALDRVHRAGLIHRDLKPGNIMLTKSGAKILDFGISKATASPPGSATAVTAPTPADLTVAGTLVGTLRYMAPEQLEGRVVDTRSDIFAFGAVLYEMVSGQPAFGGPSGTSIMTAIREQDPPSSPHIVPAMDRVVRTCLAKDPDDRWQTARDLLRELRWIQDGLKGAEERLAAAARGSRWTGATSAAALAAALAIGAAGAAYLLGNRAEPETPTVRFELTTPPTTDPMSFALSPDGRQLAFVATKDGVARLWVRPLDQVTAQALDGTDGATFPFWAPDGRDVAYFADGRLHRIGVRGGRPQVLADAPSGRGGSWNRDGVILFAPTTASGLMQMKAAGGTTRAATQFGAGENSHRWPQFLPDGRRFLYLSTQGRPGTSGVFLGSLDSAQRTRLLDDDAPAAFVPPDRLLVTRQGTLVALPFDARAGLVSEEPAVVAKPVGFDTQLVRPAVSVSDAGVLAHRSAIATRRQLTWVDRTGVLRGTVGPVDEHGLAAPDITPDDRQVAVFRTVDANTDVWSIPIEGGVPSRFTFSNGVDGFPLWSPAGDGVLFTSLRASGYQLLERSLQGRERILFEQPEIKIPLDFSPDGKHLLYAVQVPETGVDLLAVSMPVTGDREPIPVAQTPFDEMAGQFSPTGQWVAYQSNATGPIEIYVRPFPGPGTARQVSLGGGTQPRWSPDGKELLFVAPDGHVMTAAVRVDPSGRMLEALAPRVLFQTQLATGANISPAAGSRAQYALTRDGRLLMNLAMPGAPAPPITVVLNWRAAVTR